MRIGELAAKTGVSVRSLRYYEEQGLLSSARSASGQRHYTEEQVDRVAFIQRLYAAGLSSRTIAELLPCVDAPSEETADAALARLTEERDRLSGYIDDLTRTRQLLDDLIAQNLTHRDGLSATPVAAAAASGAGPLPVNHRDPVREGVVQPAARPSPRSAGGRGRRSSPSRADGASPGRARDGHPAGVRHPEGNEFCVARERTAKPVDGGASSA